MRVLNKLRIAAITIAATIIAGCHGFPKKLDETAVWTNETLYAEAQNAFTTGNWRKCSEYFELLQGRDSFGHCAQQAQINVAYCEWKDNKIASAKQVINRFIQLHPDHPDIAYAYYLKGLMSFNANLDLFSRLTGQDITELDPQALRDSHNAFRVIVEQHPSSKYAPDAAQRMRYIVNALASHEAHTADYYYRRGAYIAAINRAKIVLQEYKNSPATEDALHLMILSYHALNLPQLANDAQRILTSTFPNSLYVTDHSYALRKDENL
ncbi:outer membrane protein assembly factor BamD [Candidatus Vallotia cooleyia]|uniref:outer membrane protein assembly factor BamD n=1 Tax=Candidatus Vallotiella adelgis TaxID=1177211 RepID=UPI001D017968|nr:outer membrane protein assembly factor BamD [Candidatus Vallotia cooleyia]UDG81947.1 Outer membrane protein assembly factor BamD [Candidatus Vallotia cooleyia]